MTNPLATAAAIRIAARLPILTAAITLREMAQIIEDTMREHDRALDAAQLEEVAQRVANWPIDPHTGAKVAPR